LTKRSARDPGEDEISDMEIALELMKLRHSASPGRRSWCAELRKTYIA
jgi:hypothetical protein